MDFELLKKVVQPADSKILLCVLDGLGGLRQRPSGKTELETANTVFFDKLAADGVCGLHQPIGPGLTPGSGPSHLALFGYDPVRYQIGRGVLSALGVGFDLRAGDVAARGNFCTVDARGVVTDRRAGRIETDLNRRLCERLSRIELPDAELLIEPVKEHRFLCVLRGEGLAAEVCDTDPQLPQRPPKTAEPLSPAANRTADLVRMFVQQAGAILKDQPAANSVLLRGFAQLPDWPLFPAVYGLRAAAIAGYPMYKGLARLLGMAVLDTETAIDRQVDAMAAQWSEFDFFYLHFKPTDSAGEDGDFDRKVRMIEQVDDLVPRLQALNPDVIVVTGDHSTPAVMQSHSWHPVPVLLWSKTCRPDTVTAFGERDCVAGALGPALPAVDLMPLMMGHAGRLAKFGA